MASNPSEELSKRWPDNKVTTFTVEHDWMVGPFPGLPELLATGKSNWKEITSPKFAADEGHNLQLQVALKFERFCDDKEWVFFKLYCYSEKEVASEVPVSFKLSFFDGSDDSGFSYSKALNRKTECKLILFFNPQPYLTTLQAKIFCFWKFLLILLLLIGPPCTKSNSWRCLSSFPVPTSKRLPFFSAK